MQSAEVSTVGHVAAIGETASMPQAVPIVVKAPAVEAAPTSGHTGEPNQAGSEDLLFKVANATAAALAHNASAKSPAVAKSNGSPSKAQNGAMHTPKKQGGGHGRTPQTGTTKASNDTGNGDDSDLDGTIDLDDDDGFMCTPSPNRRTDTSPLAPYGGKGGGGKGRRAYQRHEDNESRSAIARRALPRSHAPMMRDYRPPLPPPNGSLKALPAEHVSKFLKLVQGQDYSEALRALRKVRRAVKGRGCSKEAFGGMRALLHHLLEGYASAGRLAEALDLLENMKNGTEARLVSAAAFNAVLRGVLARGALDEARFVVRDEMVRLAVSPNEGSLNLLMDTAARAGPVHIEEAWDILEEMQTKQMRADKYTVSILTKGISDRTTDKRRAPRGVILVENFLRSQPDDVDEVLVNSLLDVFCRMGDMPRLEATLVKMREYGIRGSAVTYGTIVKAYGKSGNIDKVMQAWLDMSSLGLEANAVTYGCMLDACVKCGHLDKALEVFAAMKLKNLHRNTILYATLIKGFAKSKDPLAARNIHEEMVREGVTCNVVVFNSLIDACVRANDLGGAAEVLQQMTMAGVKPDLITFSTLIKGYCCSGELSKAMRLADELRARELECDEIVYNSLLEGCVKAGDLQLGLRLFTEMRQAQVRPSSVTFSILVKLLSRAGRLDLACHLVAREMREMHQCTPTRMVWSCLVTCCVKARDLTRATMVLDLVDREGGAVGSARTSMYATVIEGCLTQGEVGIALALCERAYTRVPPEEGVRGILSADLLRRVFEAVGVRGPEAEARGLLDSIGSRLSDQVRSSLEEALSRGSRRRSPQTGGNQRGSAPRVGVSEASSIASLGADALLHPSANAAWSGGVVAAAAQQWSPYGGLPSLEAQAQANMGNGLGMNAWDPAANAAAAMAAAQATQWGAWPGQSMPGVMPGVMPGMEAFGGAYGNGFEQFYNAGYGMWPQQAWDDNTNWAAVAAAAAAAAAGTAPAGAVDYAAMAAMAAATTPSSLLVPEMKVGEAASNGIPSTAEMMPPYMMSTVPMGGGMAAPVTPQANKCMETPSTAATTAAGSDTQSPADKDDAVQQLFGTATDVSTKEGGRITPMRVEGSLSALLNCPPGLH